MQINFIRWFKRHNPIQFEGTDFRIGIANDRWKNLVWKLRCEDGWLTLWQHTLSLWQNTNTYANHELLTRTRCKLPNRWLMNHTRLLLVRWDCVCEIGCVLLVLTKFQAKFPFRICWLKQILNATNNNSVQVHSLWLRSVDSEHFPISMESSHQDW